MAPGGAAASSSRMPCSFISAAFRSRAISSGVLTALMNRNSSPASLIRRSGSSRLTCSSCAVVVRVLYPARPLCLICRVPEDERRWRSRVAGHQGVVLELELVGRVEAVNPLVPGAVVAEVREIHRRRAEKRVDPKLGHEAVRPVPTEQHFSLP